MNTHVELGRELIHLSEYDLPNLKSFQEEILSVRKLYFIDNKVYYRCNTCNWSEDNPRNNYHTSRQRRDAVGTLLTTFEAGDEPEYILSTYLFYYTQRKLSDQKDAINAMAGILRRISDRLQCSELAGMPMAHFDFWLLFTSFGPSLGRRNYFPSYSWAGWITSINYLFNRFEDSIANTWIIWYVRNSDGTTTLIQNPQPGKRGVDQSIVEVLNLSKHSATSASARETGPSGYFSTLRSDLPYDLLQFWTVSLHFSLRLIKDQYRRKSQILDCFGRYRGEVLFDGEILTGMCEFVLLSKSIELAKEFSIPTISSGNDLYFVMLILWKKGIAERRGLGQIRQCAIEHSFPPGPVWKEIVLG